MIRSDGPFDREGVVTKFFEKAPFVGFIVIAGIHAFAGNEMSYTPPLLLLPKPSLTVEF